MKKAMAIICLLSQLVFLNSCDLSQLDDNLPKKEWKIAAIEYWTENSYPVFSFKIEGVTDFDDHSYFFEQDLRKPVFFKDMFSIPGVENTGEGVAENDGDEIETNGAMPTSNYADITYHNKWFYEYTYGDGLFSGTWSAKIRIVTQRAPITIKP